MAMKSPESAYAHSSSFPQDGPNEATLKAFVELARQHLYIRRSRERIFPPDLFADAAWDMLLDLFICEQASREVSVSSACVAACVPPTTALRWVAKLEEMGLIERRADGADGRRYLLRLSIDGRAYLLEWFSDTIQHETHDIVRSGSHLPDASLRYREPLDLARELVFVLKRNNMPFN